MLSSQSLDFRSFLGLHPSSERLSDCIKSLSSLVTVAQAEIPEVKSYPDAVYFNYFSFGISLLFSPQDNYKPTIGLKREDLIDDRLVLDSVDIYNVPRIKRREPGQSRSADFEYSSFPVLPFILSFSAQTKDGRSRPEQLAVLPETTGKDFVECLGEPDRKGGGSGPSSGSISIWCEWSKDGIMVEFGGDEARGPQAWEKGRDAVWKVVTIFQAHTA